MKTLFAFALTLGLFGVQAVAGLVPGLQTIVQPQNFFVQATDTAISDGCI